MAFDEPKEIGSFADLLSALKPSKEFLKKASLFTFLASVLIPFGVEHFEDFFELGPSSHVIQRSLPGHRLYAWLSTLSPRKPRSHFVRLVVFRKGSVPDEAMTENSPCPQRAFTAKLLEGVARANPAVIVIDKRYSANIPCAAGETELLQTTLSWISSTIPVIVGDDARSAERLKNEDPVVVERLANQQALVAFPTLAFDNQVSHGVLLLDADERRIPLDWPVYPTLNSVLSTKPSLKPSLAVAAVQAFDPAALTQPRIKQLRNGPNFPFTSFLSEKQIGSYTPQSIVCAAEATEWTNCAPGRADLLRNRIVVIGEDSAADYHSSILGEVPGVVMQANYIESLLDDRYLYPAWWPVDLLFSIIWVILIEYFFDKLPFGWAVLISSLFTLIGGFVFYDIFVVQFGIYVLLLPPSLLVIALKILGNVRKRWEKGNV